MKKTRFITALAAIALAVTSLFGVLADSVSGNVVFDGKAVTPDYSAEDISKSFSGLMPGDEMSFTFNLKNNSGKDSDWYMVDKVISSFEDGAKAANGAYTYEIKYVSPAGAENIIFSSESVGGDEESGEPTGLHQATTSLEDYFYLDTIKAGQSGKVVISIAIDGESHSNTYMDTFADLNVNFAVEVPETTTTTVYVTAPRTGDDSSIALFAGAALISALAVAGITVILKRRGNV